MEDKDYFNKAYLCRVILVLISISREKSHSFLGPGQGDTFTRELHAIFIIKRFMFHFQAKTNKQKQKNT